MSNSRDFKVLCNAFNNRASKRRRLHGPSDNELPSGSKESPNFLKNQNIYILPTGIGSARRKVLQNLVLKHGGVVDSCVSDRTTHVLVDETVPSEKVCSILKWTTYPPHINVLMVGWLSSCIRANCCIDTTDFEIPCMTESFLLTQNTDSVASNINNQPHLIGPINEVNHGITPDSLSENDDKGNIIDFVPSNQAEENPNKFIIEKLQAMFETYRSEGDIWRSRAYEKAIIALKGYNKAIKSWEEAKSINGVGEKIANKIWEIIETGNLRKIEEMNSHEKTISMSLFTKVWGIGPSTADALFQQGYRTLDDLKKANLTKSQQIGLKYFEDLNTRMPRSEADKIITIVKNAISTLFPAVQCEACGSYRRKEDTCGDVDILLTLPQENPYVDVLPKLIAKLHDIGFLTDDLVKQEENGSQTKYMGICKLNEKEAKHRRLDIFVAPFEEHACALLHLTGPASFNRALRQIASEKDLTLNEHSLKVKGGLKTSDVILPTSTEQSIFKHLGVADHLPEERKHFATEY